MVVVTEIFASCEVDSALSHVPIVVNRRDASAPSVIGVETLPSRLVTSSVTLLQTDSFARLISRDTGNPAIGDISLRVNTPLTVNNPA